MYRRVFLLSYKMHERHGGCESERECRDGCVPNGLFFYSSHLVVGHQRKCGNPKLHMGTINKG